MKIVSRIAAVTMAAGLVWGVAATPAAAQSSGQPFSVFATVLRGENEPAGGDADGIGVAVVKVSPADAQVCYLLVANKLDTVVAAHIHHAPAGVNGPVVIPLQAPISGFSAACADISAALAADLVANPDQYYVNVHTTVFPGGAIRGQLP